MSNSSSALLRSIHWRRERTSIDAAWEPRLTHCSIAASMRVEIVQPNNSTDNTLARGCAHRVIGVDCVVLRDLLLVIPAKRNSIPGGQPNTIPGRSEHRIDAMNGLSLAGAARVHCAITHNEVKPCISPYEGASGFGTRDCVRLQAKIVVTPVASPTISNPMHSPRAYEQFDVTTKWAARRSRCD